MRSEVPYQASRTTAATVCAALKAPHPNKAEARLSQSTPSASFSTFLGAPSRVLQQSSGAEGICSEPPTAEGASSTSCFAASLRAALSFPLHHGRMHLHGVDKLATSKGGRSLLASHARPSETSDFWPTPKVIHGLAFLSCCPSGWALRRTARDNRRMCPISHLVSNILDQ